MQRLIVLSLILLVSACAKPPTTMVVAPSFVPTQQPSQDRGPLDLQVIDNRGYRHVLHLTGSNEPQNLINASQQPQALVNESFEQQLKQQGFWFSPTANNNITVNIEQMLISLSQHSFKYTSTSNIVLSVDISNGEQTLNKQYKASGQSHGPFTADIAVLERIFNQQLSKLILEITRDPQIQQYLTH